MQRLLCAWLLLVVRASSHKYFLSDNILMHRESTSPGWKIFLFNQLDSVTQDLYFY